MNTLLLALLLTQQTPYVETIEVRVNNVDVVVTDRDGKPVTGLRKEDFIVLEDGLPQTVTNFATFGESAGAVAGQPSAAPQAAAQPRAPRHFIFFFDEMALHPVTRGKMLSSAKELLQKTMLPGDEVMIMTPAVEDKIALPFTSDAKQINDALDRVLELFHSRAMTQASVDSRRLDAELARVYGVIVDFGPERQPAHRNDRVGTLNADADTRDRLVRALITDYAEAVRRRVRQRLGQLQSIVASLGEIPGRKVLVFVTTSTPSLAGKDMVDQFWKGEWGRPREGRDYYDMTPLIANIAQTASVNGTTIYSLQPDINAGEMTGGPDVGRIRSGGSGIPARDLNTELVQNERTLDAISAPTGGNYARGDGNVDDLFRQIGNDITTYYSIGYRASENDTDTRHRVEVQVKDRPELRVRAKRDVLRKSPDKEMDDQTVAALLRDGGNELGIGVETGAVEKDGKQVFLPVTIRVPFKNLTFIQAGNDMQHATFRVHVALLGERIDFATGETREQDVDVPAAELAESRAKYFTYETKVRIQTGKFRMAVGVFDPLSKLAGFKTMDIEAK